MALDPRDLINAGLSGASFGRRLVRHVTDAVRGKADARDAVKLAEHIYEVIGDVSEAEEEMILLVAIAAALTLGEVIAAVEAAGLEGIVGKTQAARITRMTAFAEGQRDRVQKEIDRARGVLNEYHVSEIAAAVRTAHRVGMVVSHQYQDFIEAQLAKTQELAKTVFGEASYLNSAMVLLQGTIYDITALGGNPVNIAETRLFGTMADVTDVVARESRRYARQPGAFWFDLNRFFFRPLAVEREGILRQQGGRLDTFFNRVTDADVLATGVSNALANFQRRADPFLDPEQDTWLRAFRRDFKTNVGDKLTTLDRIIETELPAYEVAIQAANNDIAEQGDKIKELETMTANPNDLSEEQKRAVAERHNSWIANAINLAGGENTDFAAALDRYKTLLAEVEAGQ